MLEYVSSGSSGSVSVPSNALTLEEVHARENIHPSTSQKEHVEDGPSRHDNSAFHKLLAAMQSKKTQQDEVSLT